MANNDSKKFRLGKEKDKRQSRLELEEVDAEPKVKKVVASTDPKMRESLSGPKVKRKQQQEESEDNPPLGKSVESVKKKQEKKKKKNPWYKHPLFILAYTVAACSFFLYLLTPRMGTVEAPYISLTTVDNSVGGPLVSYFIIQNELKGTKDEPPSYQEPLGVREGRFLSSIGFALQYSGNFYNNSGNYGRYPQINEIMAVQTVPANQSSSPDAEFVQRVHRDEIYISVSNLGYEIGQMISTNKVRATDVIRAGNYLQFRGRSLLDTTLEDEELRNKLRIEDAVANDVLNNNIEFQDVEPTLRIILPEKLFNQVRETHNRYFD